MRRILYLQGFCEEVDDAVQEVFIKVYRAKAIPREEAFLAWFYRVILNTGRDHGRRRKTRYGLMDKLQQIAPEATVDPPSEPGDPALRAALATLPDELRECVALRFFADLPLEEIAVPRRSPWAPSSRACTARPRSCAPLWTTEATNAMDRADDD